MKKLMIALAGTMAIGLTAQAANEWFDTKINTYTEWPTNNAAEFGGTWNNTTAATLEASALKVDTDDKAPLQFAATDAKDTAKGTVAVTSQMTFTPFAASDIPEVPTDAKAGVIAVIGESATNFYALAQIGQANGWTNTTITATDNSATVVVTFADGKVKYTINGKDTDAYPIVLPTDTMIHTANFIGTGKVASLAATFEAAAVGPTPAPGSNVKVEPVAGESNTYVVTPTGESKDVALANVTAGDKLIIDPTKVDSVSGVEGATIIVRNGTTDIPVTVFKGLTGSKFDATLNPAGYAEIGSETIQVTPELSDSTDAVKPFEVGEDAKVGAKTIPGLTYQLVRGEEVGAITTKLETEGAKKLATETRTELKDVSKPTAKAFYIIEVTK